MKEGEGTHSEQEDLAEQLNRLAIAFERLTADRHETGAAEYGSFTFLEADTLDMLLEELADIVNYARYTAIKVMLLQNYLASKADEAGADEGVLPFTAGTQGFIPRKEQL
jgi:hypothetical protein